MLCLLLITWVRPSTPISTKLLSTTQPWVETRLQQLEVSSAREISNEEERLQPISKSSQLNFPSISIRRELSQLKECLEDRDSSLSRKKGLPSTWLRLIACYRRGNFLLTAETKTLSWRCWLMGVSSWRLSGESVWAIWWELAFERIALLVHRIKISWLLILKDWDLSRIAKELNHLQINQKSLIQLLPL